MKETLILVAVAVLGGVPPARAHDLGVTQAIATFRSDGAYQVDVSVDPDALLMKLEIAAGGPISSSSEVDDRDRRIRSLADVFLEGVDIRFDGRADRPLFFYEPAPGSSGPAQKPSTVRLTGAMPKDARAWTFQYDFAMGWFALDSLRGGRAQTIWLEGGKQSAPIAIGVAQAPAEQAGAEQGAEQARPLRRVAPLFVLGIVVMSRRRR